MATKTTLPAQAAPVDKTRHLQIVGVASNTEDHMLADLVTDGLVSNASTASGSSSPSKATCR